MVYEEPENLRKPEHEDFSNGKKNAQNGRIPSEIYSRNKYPPLVRQQPLTNHPQCRNPFPQQNQKGSRLIHNTGKYNVSRNQSPEYWLAHIRDFSHTLVESPWKWILLIFVSSYVFSWLLFAWFYQLIAISNGDHDGNYTSDKPCLIGINSFTGYYLFSLETQISTGFGTRFITDNCPEGVFILSMQVILGSAICGGMASLVYTKMVKPQSPASKKLFSKNAVICQRNGQLCLIFRVRDLDKRHQVGTKVNAFMIERRKEAPFLRSIDLDPPGLLIWPIELVHRITPTSPLWHFSAQDFLKIRVEFILTLEGTSMSTGQASTTKTSYVNSEILWGHRFKPCIRYESEFCTYIVDQDDFHETEEIITPLCSASQLYQIYKQYHDSLQSLTSEKIRSKRSSPIYLRLGNKKAEKRSSSPSSGSTASMKEENFKSPEEDHHHHFENNFSKAAFRKLSVISESKSREGLENEEVNEQDNCSKNRKHEDNDIKKLEEDLDKCLHDLNQDLMHIETKPTKREKNDVESLVLDLQNYLET